MSEASVAMPPWPCIIQGGMGVGVSGWPLARAVALRGQLGVVSGTAIDSVFIRRLQDGDPGGALRRAMARFPISGVAERALRDFHLPQGRADGAPYKLLPMFQQAVTKAREQLTMLAAFVEVTLAKEGHSGRVGMNLLTKVQMPNLATLQGAMLAGVDFVLMGAGIPREIPGALDALAAGREARMRLEIEDDTSGATETVRFDPQEHFDGAPPAVERPRFLAIVSGHLLATVLARKASGRVDGFVVEGHRAGGHNAPPRVEAARNERGEPVYGERDVADLAKMRDLGVPFWLAGSTGRPERLLESLAAGATGVQVGGLFAFCDESGVEDSLKRSVIAAVERGELDVYTDPLASPTGYPFKIANWPGGPARDDASARERLCDLGGLRLPYRRKDGGIGYRCASEPVEQFVAKGGDATAAEGRRCLCNALMATIGQAQTRPDGHAEPPLVTAGDDLMHAAGFLAGRAHYSAGDVIDYLLGVPAAG